MMNKRYQTLLTCGVAMALPALSASAQLFSDNFDVDSSANWNINVDGQGEATFGFDYSTLGVPSAPNGTGTTGLHMRANWDAETASGVSVSPIGESFTGDYTLKFDAWGNFHGGGDLSQGGSGSTQFNGSGIGTAGDTAQWGAGANDSLQFMATADGWSAQDYRVYNPGGLVANGDGTYAAPEGDANDTNDYYSVLGGQEAPAAQVAISADQGGFTRSGASGMAWREVEIAKVGDTVTWTMDGLLLATVENYSSLGVSGDNIFFTHLDLFAGSATDPDDMLFSLVDNATVIPEPSTYALFAGLGFLGLAVWRRSRRSAA